MRKEIIEGIQLVMIFILLGIAFLVGIEAIIREYYITGVIIIGGSSYLVGSVETTIRLFKKYKLSDKAKQNQKNSKKENE